MDTARINCYQLQITLGVHPTFSRFLGIATLLLYVPVELGVLHQAGGVTVLTTLLYVLHTVRLPPVAVLAAL